MRLTPVLRQRLKRPIGQLLTNSQARAFFRRIRLQKKSVLIAIGDVSVLALLRHRLFPALAVFDGKTRRRPIPAASARVLKKSFPHARSVRNPPGTLSPVLVKQIRRFFNRRPLRPAAIRITGEDDLAALPTIRYAPDRALVLYGQPGKGLVIVKVSARKRALAQRLLAKFKK